MMDIPARRLGRGVAAGLGAAAVAVASAVVPLGAAAADPGDQVTLMTFNDFHGAIGGAAGLVCAVETVRAESDTSVLLSAGDNVGGSAFASAVQNDEPTIDVLNAMGVDATAIGNHEYDQGVEDLLERIEPRTAFPDLAANVYDEATGDRIHDAYTVIDRDGVKIAVIGAVTTKTVGKVSPAAIEGLEFGDPVDAVNDVVAEMASDGVEYDILIASYHEGASANAEPGVAPDNTDPIFDKIVTETSAEVDAIFNGDSHRVYNFNAPVPGQDGEERAIVQTGSSAANLGVVNLELGEDGDWDVLGMPELIATPLPEGETCAITTPVVEDVTQIAQDAIDQAAVVGAEPVGSVDGDVTTSWDDSKASYVDGIRTADEPVGNQATTKGDNRTRHSAAGNMLADSMRWYLEDAGLGGEHEVIGFMNPGGIRAELWYEESAADEGEGVVTYAEANSMVPFGNTLNSGEVTGAQFDQMLEEQWQRNAAGGAVDPGDESFLAFGVSENVEYAFDSSAERDDRIIDIRIDGEPIDLDAMYTIVAASFLFEGGDNMHALAEAENVRDSGVLDRDAFIGYLEAHEGLDPDYSQRQLDVELRGAAAPDGQVLRVSKAASQSLGAPEIETVHVDAGELGTFETPYEYDEASGTYYADIALGAENRLSAEETAALTITTTPSAGTSVTFELTGQDVSFTDIDGNLFVDEIMWMAENGYSYGWYDEETDTSEFRPLQPVNRDAMAAFLYRLAGSPEVDLPRSEPFTDVEKGDEHYAAMMWAYQQGITEGWDDGTFRPTTPIARDAMAAFVYRYAGSPDVEDPTSAVFDDVSASNQFATEIAWMRSEEITTGWPDGTYRPLAPTNRDATAAFLFRMTDENEITFMSEQD
ncbi:bifunctional metallophosphatase/5'-nucleotidase [Brachybacterium vulturis]|uniref:Bifunctional metallophosphatase/5'-nucleotidase n=1 Tax=Brachybacterium vulturis TaxID=2017484 RepID=A0A291GKQ5_9MICO|nr:5'-nucleotidase C-terminal domain-containing protein [Brachybacterium vulturis]ATG50929.1 bifunctional metallophosphatase/5'-nucleotidase [Brachybacterium vulturis]